ncbi:MAG: tol-pal system protein YbgF [Sediminimonas qiaohouensis]|uniref:Cell division coordinator CpoB n=1 Tax=Sediminimonas qiaohouensis TaxID=552061 RepID=A0A7C9L5T9_9RHOB|nr:tol-pal system protein YbgF [Sediminimonas qiaohouensis]MTJ03233.1 tol-pal system protein YbgF [Sediminimonas qiaohouensis]
MLRAVLAGVLVVLALAFPGAGHAQQQAETLADIRQELTVLNVEIQRLKRELSTTGAPSVNTGQGGSTIERVNAIESALQQLTEQTEVLEHRIDKVVRDGTNRIGDLEFRLCEMEADCDIASLGETPSLGGVDASGGGGGAAPADNGTGTDTQPEMAVGEQADFDAATKALEGGDAARAAQLFAGFLDDYPRSPLAAGAHLGRGVALDDQGDRTGAARAYLEAFSVAPSGEQAPEALFRLGRSLGQLGKVDEACVTLSEVGTRFPNASEVVSRAQAERARLECM